MLRRANLICSLTKIIVIIVFITVLFSCGTGGKWPKDLVIVPEKTDYTQTSLHEDVINFVEALESRSENVFVEYIATSFGDRKIPLVVISEPKIKTPEEAVELGKPVIYLQGNIHGGEVDGKEALMQVMREVAYGEKKSLLENQVLLFCPIFNTDGNDALGDRHNPGQDGSPALAGMLQSGEGFDLDYDAIKLLGIETRAWVENILLKWDPVFMLDMHTSNGTWHGFSITYTPSGLPSAHQGVQSYLTDAMLPSIKNFLDTEFAMDAFQRGGFSVREDGWPPKKWSNSGYFPYGWNLVNYLGLRNRMAIDGNSFSHDPFFWRIRSSYALAMSVIEYTNLHGKEIAEIVKKADQETVQNIIDNNGNFKNGVKFDVRAFDEPVDIMSYEYEAYQDTVLRRDEETKKDKEVEITKYNRTDKIVKVENVIHENDFYATVERTVPRGYVFPFELRNVAEKLARHGIKVERIESPVKLKGEEFIISKFIKLPRGMLGHLPNVIEGTYRAATKEIPAGSFKVDMAQPLAHLIFYMLEPEVYDGLVFWNYYEDYLLKLGVENKKVPFPVFKYFDEK